MNLTLPDIFVNPDNDFYFSDENKIAWNFRHEFLLNNVNGRGASFTAKHKVGPTSHLINNSKAVSYNDWVNFYFEHAIEEKKGGEKITTDTFFELGLRLKERMNKIFVDMMKENMPNIPDYVYAAFLFNLTINRTWDGYLGEKSVENFLQDILKTPVFDSKELEDKYLVDKHINIGPHKIGFQIKPTSFLNDHVINNAHLVKHKLFQNDNGGSVFFVHYDKKFGVVNSKELIHNIQSEINKLIL